VPTEVIEAMVKSPDRRATFASSVARSIRDADLNGIEINFRLDAKGGSKYSKEGLVALAKVRDFVQVITSQVIWFTKNYLHSEVMAMQREFGNAGDEVGPEGNQVNTARSSSGEQNRDIKIANSTICKFVKRCAYV
jgi:hypothetical protein